VAVANLFALLDVTRQREALQQFFTGTSNMPRICATIECRTALAVKPATPTGVSGLHVFADAWVIAAIWLMVIFGPETFSASPSVSQTQ
jgi:hypothetical protein